MEKNCVKQVLVESVNITWSSLMKNGNLLKSRVSEICVTKIPIDQGAGVIWIRFFGGHQVFFNSNKKPLSISSSPHSWAWNWASKSQSRPDNCCSK